MSGSGSRYVAGVALVGGEAAAVLYGVLTSRHVAEMLTAMGARDPGLGVELEAVRDALQRAAAEDRRRRVSGDGNADGSAETWPGPDDPRSPHEIDTSEAADLLRLTPRRARQLGPILGRRCGGRWLLDRRAVLDYAQQRRGAEPG